MPSLPFQPVARETFHVEACGARLRAQWIRPPGAAPSPALVFLHEALGSIPQWRDFPSALCAAACLPGLVYERRGFGGSDPLAGPHRPLDYLHHEARDVLPEVLSACGVTRPVLVGHSDGGTIALLFAAAFPDGAAALVTEAAHVLVEDVTIDGIRRAEEAWRTTDLKSRLSRHHGEKTDELFQSWAGTWTRGDFRDWSIVEELAAVSCPALVIQGLDDEYGSPAQVDAIVRAVSGPAHPFLIPGCGHVPHRQAAEAVLQAVLLFLGAHGLVSIAR
ncbi:alpha/beta hydrolase [Acidobacteria bacterium ACD]|nr:MAG: alpha/beta hydrolase [Acidobacteriota bacterium]MCE7956948.1 alpha/beta hydrolase [Acidobacteria bacterium ACB2]MDL1949193.1 alpha/beta hydrolase [Acidobacteria bacterium ACD]